MNVFSSYYHWMRQVSVLSQVGNGHRSVDITFWWLLFVVNGPLSLRESLFALFQPISWGVINQLLLR